MSTWPRLLVLSARLMALVLVATVGLQLYFVGRIALMAVAAPTSTAFQRSEAWRIAVKSARRDGDWRWRQQWVDGGQISPHLWRAVVASEDAEEKHLQQGKDLNHWKADAGGRKRAAHDDQHAMKIEEESEVIGGVAQGHEHHADPKKDSKEG